MYWKLINRKYILKNFLEYCPQTILQATELFGPKLFTFYEQAAVEFNDEIH